MKITNIPTEVNTTSIEINVGENTYIITVKENLTTIQFNGMCTSITNGCFSKDGDYKPYIKQQLINAYTIDYYTDIELSDDDEENSALYNNFGLIKKILEVIDTTQYVSVLETVNEMIDLRINKFNYNDLAVSELCGILGDIRTFLQTSENKMKKFDANKAIKDISKFDPNKFKALAGIKDMWNKAMKSNDFSEIVGINKDTEDKNDIVMTENK